MRYEIFSDGSASLLKLNSMGVSGDANVTKFGPARRDLYIIHYVTKGKGYYNGHFYEFGQTGAEAIVAKNVDTWAKANDAVGGKHFLE